MIGYNIWVPIMFVQQALLFIRSVAHGTGNDKYFPVELIPLLYATPTPGRLRAGERALQHRPLRDHFLGPDKGRDGHRGGGGGQKDGYDARCRHDEVPLLQRVYGQPVRQKLTHSTLNRGNSQMICAALHQEESDGDQSESTRRPASVKHIP